MTVTAQPVTPRYQHDCGPEHGCRFLGTVLVPATLVPTDDLDDLGDDVPGPAASPDGRGVVDLWVHAAEQQAVPAQGRSLIYRWDDEDSAYCSMPETIFDHPAAATNEGPVFALLRVIRALADIPRA